MPYVCVSHASSQKAETDGFCHALARYGFRYACISELTAPQDRGETLTEASLLIALTSPAAVLCETVASDIRRGLERGMTVLCVSLDENELDDRFCASDGGAVLIPAPASATPDRHSVALFLHRLFVRHLARLSECFSAVRCVDDANGCTVMHAVAAHKGDAAACYALGLAYERGEAVPALENEAAKWISLAAAAGFPDARIRMGELLLVGRGTERDTDEAFRLFAQAAEEGDVRGEYHRGLCYLRGSGVMKDPERALHYQTVAAKAGYPPALYRLGLLYRDGVGTAPDHRIAVRLIYTACQRAISTSDGVQSADLPPLPSTLTGHPVGMELACISMRQLRRTRLKPILHAQFAEKGKIIPERKLDTLTARSFARSHITSVTLPEDGWLEGLFDLSAEHAAENKIRRFEGNYPPSDLNVAEAAVALGSLLAQGDAAHGIRPHPTRALVWYRFALRMGDPEALYRLGDAYRRGHGIPADPDRAFRLFSLAAALGNEKSQFALGVCYEQGIGTQPDMDEAFACYEQAAAAGYPPAQNNLGGCYEYGLGVVQDLHAAVEWYARAAAEEPAAACRLALCYEQGRGVETDAVKAYRLFETAAQAGHPYAQYRLGLCCDCGVYETPVEDIADADQEIPHDTILVEKPAKAEHPILAVAPNYARAVRLFEQAARGGVADAAYVLYLCYTGGRGVRMDGEKALGYLREAAAGGCIPACYSLGMAYLEGTFTVQDPTRAVTCFADAAALWAENPDHARRAPRPDGVLALKGLTPAEAAGEALYMLGYCALYAIGDTANPAISARKGAFTSAERVRLAADYFREASHVDHVGAITALGDLYAYGLLKPETASAEDESLRYYMEAARVGAAREFVSDASTDSPINALMSLVARSTQVAETCAAEGDYGSAELARVQAWRSLAGCAEEGSVDALVSMAACTFRGYGTPENPDAAEFFLKRAEEAEGGRVTASLWLGDLYRVGRNRATDPDLADKAYLRALTTPYMTSECGPYTIRERREARKALDRRARAEALYRLATLRAVCFADGDNARESFPYLAKAVLMGHAAAREDLARMYAYESTYIASTTPKDKGGRLKGRGVGGMLARRRLHRHTPDSATPRDNRAGRSHQGWMTDYYTALWLTPELFSYGMRSEAVPADRPAYVTAEVTDAMRAASLNYLGDCLYFGNGLPADATAAADCYREVVSMRIPVPRGEKPPMGVIWAQYSYGWCLLHGVGTAKNPREAVKHLTAAAKYHAEACYCLASCYEAGEGVDVPDDREAVKYYRKALKLGYRKASSKVTELEKKLRTEE